MRCLNRHLPRGCSCFALMFALLLTGMYGASRATADPGPRAYPGMEIHQGDTVCTLGFVETRLRMAVTAGKCDRGSGAAGALDVTDSSGAVIGTVEFSRRNRDDGVASYGSLDGVEYEVVRLAPTVTASDVLPTGRQLRSVADTQAQVGLPVCHFGYGSGQNCGGVSSVGNGRFVIPDFSVGDGDAGGPVYTLTDDNHAVIVGLLDGGARPVPEAQSWQAIMRQLYVDVRAPDSQSPLPHGQTI